MSKKIKIIITVGLCVGIVLFAFFTSFGFYKAETYPGGPKKFLIRKVKNENMFMNFIKPSAESILSAGDLIIYKNPVLHDPKFNELANEYSRIIACPGDIVKIVDSKVFVNDKAIEESYDRYFLFRVTMEGTTNFQELLKDFKVQILDSMNNNKACNFVATEYIAEQIADADSVTNVRRILETAGTGDVNVFPRSGSTWNLDNWGPCAVPQKGVTVMLNPRNIGIYKTIIGFYENHNLFVSGENINIDDSPAEKYLIEENYYFVLNDNRYNQPDSRTWGFIPESYIIGKVLN